MFYSFSDRRQARHENKKELIKYNLLFIGLLLAFWFVVASVTKSPVVHKPTPTTPVALSSEKQAIQSFAYIVTMPVDSLSKDELALLDAKADDVCYEKYVMLSPAEMIPAIEKCKGLSS